MTYQSPREVNNPGKNPVVVLQNINLELLPIIAKIFNRCLMENSFPCLSVKDIKFKLCFQWCGLDKVEAITYLSHNKIVVFFSQKMPSSTHKKIISIFPEIITNVIVFNDRTCVSYVEFLTSCENLEGGLINIARNLIKYN